MNVIAPLRHRVQAKDFKEKKTSGHLLRHWIRGQKVGLKLQLWKPQHFQMLGQRDEVAGRGITGARRHGRDGKEAPGGRTMRINRRERRRVGGMPASRRASFFHHSSKGGISRPGRCGVGQQREELCHDSLGRCLHAPEHGEHQGSQPPLPHSHPQRAAALPHLPQLRQAGTRATGAAAMAMQALESTGLEATENPDVPPTPTAATRVAEMATQVLEATALWIPQRM